ncbi:FxsA family protein [Phaeovulum vinaykumarii]|uniref:UPF0716 protein FxsA n=1 Tax=Phaeovulum vinaykumarii TaxID=407234 RepID=A0A1N7K8W6_9RHOB|nr:FxsA family protein [Phaeovulum vinaykumarii]SIS58031.1 UPF0716 protein FxsA [Phaeovulum vinaykumarii]SOB93658.1 UPF0716 protein FxsA [Phaeovulum vinaykumarii]
MWLFAAFVAVPVIEIALFIQVGGLIGLWPTIGIVILTALAGTVLMRSQGAQALADLNRSMAELRDPTAPLAHGAMILFAGALLLTPGFFTDTVGLLLLIPGVRAALMKSIARRIESGGIVFATYGSARPGPGMGPGAPGAGPDTPRNRAQGDVIEGDFTEIDPDGDAKRPSDGSSGWTRH